MRNLHCFVLLVVVVIGCFSPGSGPYNDLEAVFKAPRPRDAKPILSKTIVLTSTKHKGAYNYRDTVDISTSSNAVHIDPNIPTMDAITIPASAMTGCSKTCFGRSKWDANILLETVGIEINILNSQEIIDWCWENHLPMISGKHRREWMYNKRPLPDKKTHAQQLSSREKYDEDTKQACLGF